VRLRKAVGAKAAARLVTPPAGASVGWWRWRPRGSAGVMHAFGVRGLLVQKTGLSGGSRRRHVARPVAAVALRSQSSTVARSGAGFCGCSKAGTSRMTTDTFAMLGEAVVSPLRGRPLLVVEAEVREPGRCEGSGRARSRRAGAAFAAPGSPVSRPRAPHASLRGQAGPSAES
jgi:hypothetical protein